LRLAIQTEAEVSSFSTSKLRKKWHLLLRVKLVITQIY